MTIRENLLVGGHIIDDEELLDRRMNKVFEAFPELEKKASAKPGQLSGGQQMMLSMGRGMMTGADVYLFDEPSAGLQPSMVQDVLELVRRINELGIQVIMIEQNVSAALQVADHVYILAQGEIQFDGPPSQLSDQDKLIELYLGI
jgi:ABC-type branched-subunit amino acid transport system ATPase component